MSQPPEPSPQQLAALADLGLNEDEIAQFLFGSPIVYTLRTGGVPGIGMVQRQGGRLRSGIIEIKELGNGVLALSGFWNRTRAVSAAFDCEEVEIFGAEVINQRLAEVLKAQGFTPQIESCPPELGGGVMEVLSKVFQADEV